MKRYLIAIPLAILILVSPVSAQVLNSRKLDSLFSLLSEKNKAMGSLAVMKEGKIIYTKAIGYSSISGTGKTAAT
ncbi:MAG TPA: hypothetical protein PLW67_08920, partial [Prolixibacteraceae bacterium]|nr:hypothetical protein [Prolixibacteraceae bacterium]